VNALKPISQARSGHHEKALSSLSRSAFRRTGRIVLPTTCATIVSSVICQFGGYELARRSESQWLAFMAPQASNSWYSALLDLLHAILRTWKDGGNDYDKIHWTLTWLLHGSFWIYLTLLATVSATPFVRMLVVFTLFAYNWIAGQG
jgi:hypothetical protein